MAGASADRLAVSSSVSARSRSARGPRRFSTPTDGGGVGESTGFSTAGAGSSTGLSCMGDDARKRSWSRSVREPMDVDVLSVLTSADGSETVTDADRVDESCVGTCVVRSGERNARASSARSAPCGDVPLLAAEVGVSVAERSGVSLRRDPSATKLPISDLSGENRETKIGISLPYQTLSVYFDSVNGSEGRRSYPGSPILHLTALTSAWNLPRDSCLTVCRPRLDRDVYVLTHRVTRVLRVGLLLCSGVLRAVFSSLSTGSRVWRPDQTFGT